MPSMERSSSVKRIGPRTTATRTVSTWKKSHAINPFAWGARNSAQVGTDLGGDGSTPWSFRIAQTLEAAMTMPMVASSPWMRR